jgi:acyl phosphate:glycerol-3-phosphate acyltransferase
MGSIIAIVIGYFLGSISCAIILSKVLKKSDPRTVGSGNAGANNVLRTIGKNEALAVLVGDALKGFIAILIGRMLGAHGFMLGLVGLAAIAGHTYPIYFKFKGGKGVATGLGSVLALNPFTAILSFSVWGGVVFFTRYSSLASMVSCIAAVVFSFFFGASQYTLAILLMTAFIIWNHRTNIERLRAGNESKIKF